MSEQMRCDVAIIGSGIGGSTLAAILARHGLRVIVFEAGMHPRFAVGESMILETSETLRAMAELYDVPELAYYSSENFFSQIGTSHGVKRHFSYLHHDEGKPQQTRRSLQAVIPKEPHGHELHLFRQDCDAHLTAVAIAYGATVLQNMAVKDIEIGAEAVTVTANNGQQFSAGYVVDAGGFRSLLADKFGWRDHKQQAHTRTIFSHMFDVPCFNSVSASREEYGVPFRFSEGTLHHIFHGGWLWVIPFNNHRESTNPLVSVGLQLDPRIHPPRPELTPEQEFFDVINRFPGIQAQFANARAVRNWTRTERLQFSSTHVVSDRGCLLGHAAGFIDPLYSKGMYTTLMSAGVLANLLLRARDTHDYSASAFASLETLTLRFVQAHDRLTANSMKSWSNYKLWEVYSVLWLTGAYLEYVKLLRMRSAAASPTEYFMQAEALRLVGGGFGPFDALANEVDDLVERVDVHDEAAVDVAVAQIRSLYAKIPWMPAAFRAVLAGKNHLPRRKVRPEILKRGSGFLGAGEFREHFFGDAGVLTVMQFYFADRRRYSARAVRANKRREYQRSLDRRI
ncbi:MAG: NAD(P)/FAD-dependent oxidoreductase [Gemmatimonadaceae bacterium]